MSVCACAQGLQEKPAIPLQSHRSWDTGRPDGLSKPRASLRANGNQILSAAVRLLKGESTSMHAQHARVRAVSRAMGGMWLCRGGEGGQGREGELYLRSPLGQPPLPAAAQPSSLGQLVGFDK